MGEGRGQGEEQASSELVVVPVVCELDWKVPVEQRVAVEGQRGKGVSVVCLMRREAGALEVVGERAQRQARAVREEAARREKELQMVVVEGLVLPEAEAHERELCGQARLTPVSFSYSSDTTERRTSRWRWRRTTRRSRWCCRAQVQYYSARSLSAE